MPIIASIASRTGSTSPCRTGCVGDIADCREHGCQWYRETFGVEQKFEGGTEVRGYQFGSRSRAIRGFSLSSDA